MMRGRLTLTIPFIGIALASLSALASANDPPPVATQKSANPKSTDVIAAGKAAFVDVARVLQSPRCMNCHPAGDAPLQTDHAQRHAMNVTRMSVDAGMLCTTCHQDRNSEAVGVFGGPPGAPDWKLPADDMPLVFQGKSVTALCEQMKNPDTNGHKDFAALLAHLDTPLVLWGWNPGGKRTIPPLSHAQFVAAFKTWIASDGACP
jgi:hypothetical protein